MTSPLGPKFIQVEALSPELIHGAVHMEQHAAETVVLVRVALRRQTFRYKKQNRKKYSQTIQHKRQIRKSAGKESSVIKEGKNW
jgi:hypothetical protein